VLVMDGSVVGCGCVALMLHVIYKAGTYVNHPDGFLVHPPRGPTPRPGEPRPLPQRIAAGRFPCQ